ncbi:MAG: MBL fold metallo-hydrolase [Candidatus Heimdallarchaeota archaeon]|nr:MBL fold metallo-hydrolase [Candidatus Heimdallarchaeota archaeon]
MIISKKYAGILIIIILVSIITLYVLNPFDEGEIENKYEPIYAETIELNGVKIAWLGFSGIKLEYNNITVYIDPFDIQDSHPILTEATYILTTHNHPDHHSHDDILWLSNNETIFISSTPCDIIGVSTQWVDVGEVLQYPDVIFEFVPMYNKYSFTHPKHLNSTGIIVDFGGFRLYHTGDSDRIEEMKSIRTDVVFHPVMGTYYMSASDAAYMIEDLKIHSNTIYSIPVHYGPESFDEHVQGDMEDVERLIELANCTVVILTPLIEH